ncbi:cupin domain-containing protein [Pedobacter boryungensis]|uniref:Cupin domain-containing protein n=1 Tax=Pedobacter boryungensis TaxID=869962 RepID=A0ABX2DC40_9SPHI|nr:cupin domain-containing protein [Pedobacter boryungensis]NQX31372.1 cupin domain-containing protein [Pedobacter boryungensis]
MIEILSKDNCLSHYKWGENCDGWNFISNPEVAIKQELMPAQTAEKLHFHQYAEQFFFILKGQATFLIEGETILVNANNGLQIKVGNKHKIMNTTFDDLEFILFSYPSTQNDRTDCE